MDHLAACGGLEVCLVIGPKPMYYLGYYYKDVKRALNRLVERGLVIKDDQGLYSLPQGDKDV